MVYSRLARKGKKKEEPKAVEQEVVQEGKEAEAEEELEEEDEEEEEEEASREDEDKDEQVMAYHSPHAYYRYSAEEYSKKDFTIMELEKLRRYREALLQGS